MMLYYLSNQKSGMTLSLSKYIYIYFCFKYKYIYIYKYIQQPTNSTENPQSPGCPLGGEKTEPVVADVEAGVEA